MAVRVVQIPFASVRREAGPRGALHPLARQLAGWLAALLLAAGLGQACAQTFGFTPTILDIDSTRNLVTETTMINSTTAPARFTVEAKVWKVVGGQAVLEDTRDLLVNPASFTVAPGGSQLIRVGVRKKPGASELSYRIVVRQETIEGVARPAVSSGFGQGRSAALNVNVVFSLPVYITPPSARPQVRFAAVPSGADLTLTVQNAGTRRAIYRDVRISRGAVSLSTQVIPALAGSSLTYTLAGLGKQTGPLTMSYTGEDGQRREETISLP